MPSSDAQSLVDKANSFWCSEFVERYITSREQQLQFRTTSGEQLKIEAWPADKLSKMDLDACFNLIRETSSIAYKNSSRGWHPSAKKEEMREENMWYLLVRPDQPDFPIAAFTSFMITIEDDYPVIYTYEIHLSPSLRGQRLGAHLMDIVEDIGTKANMTKAMLTVFTSNEGAERFYRKREYETDEFSPQERRLRGGKIKRPDYLILSKPLR